MTQPPGGGDRLDVEVVADASGFARGLQQRIDAQTRNIRARIRAEIDAKRLTAETQAAARAAANSTKVQLKVGVDREYLRQSMDRAIRDLTNRDYRVKVGVDVDSSKVQRAMDDATRGGKATVNVDADTAEAEAEVEGAKRRMGGKPVEIKVKAKKDGLKEVQEFLSKLGKVGMIAGGIQLVTTAVTALAGSLVAVVGAASQAAGALAILPNLIGVAAQGIGSLLLGFSGIGDAVSAMGKAETGSAAAASRAADTREASARRIADATRAVQKAQQQADRTAVDGARAVEAARQRVADAQANAASRIASAERQVEDAQRSRTSAQQTLNKAIEDATRTLRDYQLQLSGAALDEESAALAIERARQRLDEVNRSPGSSDLDRKEADLALRQAQQRLAEVQQSNADLQKEAEKGYAKGVMGADNVVAAQQGVEDANRNVADAEKNLADERVQAAKDVQGAQEDLQRTIEDTSQANADAAESVADAQRNLQEAYDDAAKAANESTAQADALAAAMDKLSPAGQRFATFVANVLKPRLETLKKAVQEALLPGVQEGVTRALPWLDTLEKGLVDSGTVMGDLAVKAGTLMGSGPFRADTATVMASNNRALSLFGDTGLNLVKILMDLAVAAGPLLERFAAWTVKVSDYVAKATAAGRETGKLQAFFERAGDRAAQLGRIIGNLVVSLFNMGKAGTQSGDDLLGKFEALTEKWKNWTGSTEGQDRMQKFFADMQPLTEKIAETVGLVVQAFVALGQDGGGAVGGFLDTLNFLLRAITAVLQSPFGPFVSALLAGVGALGALAFAAKPIVGIFQAGKQVADFASGIRDTADAAKLAASGAARAGKALGTFARSLNLGAIAAKGMAIAEGILNAVMAINPFVLILIAIAALVAAFIWAWNNIDGFKEGVMAALGAVRDFIVAAWNWIKDVTTAVWGAISDFFQATWDTISSIFSTVLNAIQTALSAVWNAILAVINFIWEGIKLYFQTWWTVVSTIFTTAVDAIKFALSAAWDFIKNVATTVWNAITSFFTSVWEGIKTVFNAATSFLSGLWQGFWNAISSVATTVFNAVHDFIAGVLDGIGNAFRTVVSVIGGIWDTLKAILRAPIEAIVDVVYNHGIRAVWNWINNLWDGDDLPEIHVPQFAKGGVLPGYAPGKDRIPAMLSPGEGILVPEAVVALGGADGIQSINAQFSSRVAGPGRKKRKARQEDHGKPVGLGLGDVLGAIGGAIGSGWNWATDKIGDVVGAVGDLISQGWKFAVHAAFAPIHGLVSTLFPEGNMVTGGFGKAANDWLDRVEAAVGGKEQEQAAKTAAAAGPVGDAVARWAPLVNQVLGELGQSTAAAPYVLQLIAHESGGNPAAINNWDSNAAAGHPSQGLMQTIPGTFNAYAGPYRGAGILDPHANIYAGLNYGISRYGSVMNIPGIKSLAAGGAYKPYDQGGRLRPGLTLAANKTGTDEAVLTPEAIAALGGWGPIDALNGGADLATALNRSAATSIGDVTTGDVYGIYFADGAIRLTAINPTPEPAGTSLNAGLRRAATFGIFDDAPVGG